MATLRSFYYVNYCMRTLPYYTTKENGKLLPIFINYYYFSSYCTRMEKRTQPCTSTQIRYNQKLRHLGRMLIMSTIFA